MSSAMGLYARRETLAEALTWQADETAGLPACQGHPAIPERLTAPAGLVREGTPYVQDDPAQGWARWTIRHQLDLVAPPGTSTWTTQALDAMVTEALARLTEVADTAAEVGEFYTLQANGNQHLAVTITTTTSTTDL